PPRDRGFEVGRDDPDRAQPAHRGDGRRRRSFGGPARAPGGRQHDLVRSSATGAPTEQRLLRRKTGMAIFGALSTGRSGLINTGAALSVIGNNIANVGTTGFKAARVEFADLISAEAGGEIGRASCRERGEVSGGGGRVV